MKYQWVPLLTALLLFTGALVRVDRIFFKRSCSFNLRFLYADLPADPEWQLPAYSAEKEERLDRILEQKFHYLAKGLHCFAFLSEDQKYVIKFHRYPSHMRIMPWITHPFSYRFDERRKRIKTYNVERLKTHLASYKHSFLHLQQETGILFLRIHPGKKLGKKVTVVGKGGELYVIPLDDVTFILQEKAELIYPTLDSLVKERKLEEAKCAITHIIHLIVSRCQKGYIDQDPVLHRNYGLLSDRAIQIDIGELIPCASIAQKENYIPHVIGITTHLREHLERNYPELLEHYHREIQELKNFDCKDSVNGL